jgi:hypothetical protein
VPVSLALKQIFQPADLQQKNYQPASQKQQKKPLPANR